MKNAEMLRQAARMPIRMEFWMSQSSCGTVGCIAGNVCLIEGWAPEFGNYRAAYQATKNGRSQEICDVAAELLDLNNQESCTLFYTHDWPASFRNQFDSAPLDCRPAIIQARVEAFIAEHGGAL